MGNILVAGLVNIETSVPVKGFPVEYFPIDYPFNKVKASVSGVGFNICANLTRLGDNVTFATFTGRDLWEKIILMKLRETGIETENVLQTLSGTPQSVILYDPSGKREIYCDLKDYQDASYDFDRIMYAVRKADIVACCNSNFARPLLDICKKSEKIVATDVHVLSDVHDAYNKDFLESADILFLSNEAISGREEEFAGQLYEIYHTPVIVIGMGEKGSLLYEGAQGQRIFVPSVHTREVVSTQGAGDALFSSFLHYFAKGKTVLESLQYATVVASYKIGADSSSEGFLTEDEVENLISKLH